MKAHPAHDGPLPPAPGPGAGGPRALGPGTEPRGGVLILNWRDTTHPEGGGSEVYVERIAAGLAARGRPVTLLCAAHPGAPATERVGGIRVVRRGGRLTVYLHAFWAHLTGRLGGHEVVVDVQNGLPFLSALWCRRPLVVLVHHVHREQWRVVLPPLQARIGWWIESRLAPRLYRRARYVAVSEATRRELVTLGVRPAAVTVVHNGMAATGPAAAGSRTPFPSVCVLGRLVPHKRVELALEAAARIRPHLPGLRVLVVGQGWWEPRLREAVDRLGLRDAVELLGWVDEETKQRVLASSWVLAMPSVKEGWGLAVLEAAANGTPTVAFRAAGGLRESVRHGTTGLLADDLEEFTRHLAWVLLNRHLRERLGEAARAHAARFTWPQAVAAFAAVLDGAVLGGATAPAEPATGTLPAAGEEPASGRATA
jgi:glycosyltransferase involved in cell wall biosynthesis